MQTSFLGRTAEWLRPINAQRLSRQMFGLMLAASAALIPDGLSAHHSPSGFDTKQTVTVTGTVSKYEWLNPHVYIYVDQVVGDGTVQWEIEAGPPSMMRRMGWSKETLRVGDVLTLAGSPAKNPHDKSLLAVSIKRADDTLLSRERMIKGLMTADSAGSAMARDLEGTWVTLLSVPIMLQTAFPDQAAVTPEGLDKIKRFDEQTMNPGANCVPTAAPMLMISPDLKRIERRKEIVTIESEFEAARRTIHLNVNTHEGALPSIQGHSIGRWDGNTLNIDTTHFAFHAIGNGYGLPSGPRKHLVERLSLDDDGRSLTYRFELSDPDYLKAPRTGEVKWMYAPSATYAPEPCDVGNARRFIRMQR